MREQLKRVNRQQVVLFAGGFVVAAVAALFVLQEIGWGDEPAVGINPPLVLTLEAPALCITERNSEVVTGRHCEDCEGGYEYVSLGSTGGAEMPVTWTVTGGEPPYRLTIDGEQRDGRQRYEGASGTASVSCALEHGTPSYDDGLGTRLWRDPPVVDSGPKVVSAEVVDGAGAIASAAVGTYVATTRVAGVLEGGKTYVIGENLITVPHGISVTIGSTIAIDAEEGGVSGLVVRLWLGPRPRDVPEGESLSPVILVTQNALEEVGRWIPADGDDGPAGATDTIHDTFDQLIDSVGQSPSAPAVTGE